MRGSTRPRAARRPTQVCQTISGGTVKSRLSGVGGIRRRLVPGWGKAWLPVAESAVPYWAALCTSIDQHRSANNIVPTAGRDRESNLLQTPPWNSEETRRRCQALLPQRGIRIQTHLLTSSRGASLDLNLWRKTVWLTLRAGKAMGLLTCCTRNERPSSWSKVLKFWPFRQSGTKACVQRLSAAHWQR